MADHKEINGVASYGYADAKEALAKVSQATAIMRSVSLAVDAQVDGAARFDDNEYYRWWPAIDAACERIKAIRDAIVNKANCPISVNWWTSLSLLEAIAAATWSANGTANDMDPEEIQAMADAAIQELSVLQRQLRDEADSRQLQIA